MTAYEIIMIILCMMSFMRDLLESFIKLLSYLEKREKQKNSQPARQQVGGVHRTLNYP